MAWKVLSNLKTDTLHVAGEILQTIEGVVESEIKKLEQEGIIQNLEADVKKDVGQVESQVQQDASTVAGQAEQDAELARGQVESQVQDALNKDLADANKMAQDPGQPVQAGQTQTSQPVQPPQPPQTQTTQPQNGQPTPEEIAATAAGVK